MTRIIPEQKLDKMYERYIELKCKALHAPHGSQDEMWHEGECAEAEKWLDMLGYDISYQTIRPLIDAKYKEMYGEVCVGYE